MSGARLQLRLGLFGVDNLVLIRKLCDMTQGLLLEGAAFRLHFGGFLMPTSRLLEAYLFSGSSSSSAVHKGPD